MATESSAVVRFIELAKQQEIRESEVLTDALLSVTPPPPRRGWIFAAGVGGMAALAALAGIYYALANRSPSSVESATPLPAVASAQAARAPVAAAIPSGPETLDEPTTTGAAAIAAPDPADDEQDEAAAPTAPTAPTATTGFDIRVRPKGAIVSLDGKRIGGAPLRVRNLMPGTHVLDIEAPDGYFSKHMQVELGDEPESLNVVLDLVHPDRTAEAPTARRATRPAGATRLVPAPSRTVQAVAKARPRAAAVSASADRPQAKGTLRIGAKPPCEIHIDGKNTGKMTPQRSLALDPGRHKVTLINQELRLKRRFVVNIRSGRATTVIKDYTGAL